MNDLFNFNKEDILTGVTVDRHGGIMERPTPKSGEVFRHFKGNQYKILAVGYHSESKEKMVVYFDLSGKNSTIDDPCIRPLDMFMSEVDHNKYPDVEQKYRFERA